MVTHSIQGDANAAFALAKYADMQDSDRCHLRHADRPVCAIGNHILLTMVKLACNSA
jgi:hypothetical protein